MERKAANQWVGKSEKRISVLLSLKQPMTALQLARYTGFSQDQCSMILGQLMLCGMVKCLNPTAKRSRLYWLTPIGILCQKKLNDNLPVALKDLPDIDWQLYGWVCFNHRTAIIRALTEPMQPSTIKRRAMKQNSKLKMSANNVRDVMKLFLQKKIVRPVKERKKAHLRYELTETGTKLRQLLIQAGAGISI